MKKIFMFATAAVVLAGCSNKAEFEAGIQPESQKAQQYQTAFTETFGEISTTVDWGFTPVEVVAVKAADANAPRRVQNVNRNEWGTGNGVGGHVAVPVNVTPDERTLVYNWFNQNRENYKSAQVNWEDFYVSQVWKGEQTYTDGAGNTVKGSDCMNHLQTRKAEGGINEYGQLTGGEDQWGNATAWEHVNDFNDGNQWSGYGTIEGHTFMEFSGTLEFAYHNTKDSKYHNEYIIVPGAEIDASLAGYYYVGFDFYAHGTDIYPANKNMDVERDYVFTDWIVRISPGEYVNSKRIMAEDLIASSLLNVDKSDLDFNDVVFDIAVLDQWVGALNANKRIAHITLRAAGGTLPLYIGKLEDKYEVHKLFGVETETMVNTSAQAYAKNGYYAKDNVAPVQFSIILDDAPYSGNYDYAKFPIYVGGELLVAPLGKATHKLCVPTTTKWMKEKNLITSGYPKFVDYVNTGAPADWYATVGAGLYQ